MRSISEVSQVTTSRRSVVLAAASIPIAHALHSLIAGPYAGAAPHEPADGGCGCDEAVLVAAAISEGSEVGYATVRRGGVTTLHSFDVAAMRSSEGAVLGSEVHTFHSECLVIGMAAFDAGVHVFGGLAYSRPIGTFDDSMASVRDDQLIHIDPAWQLHGQHTPTATSWQPWVVTITPEGEVQEDRIDVMSENSVIAAVSSEANSIRSTLVLDLQPDYPRVAGLRIVGDGDAARVNLEPRAFADVEYEIIVGSNSKSDAVLVTTLPFDGSETTTFPSRLLRLDMQTAAVYEMPPSRDAVVAVALGARNKRTGSPLAALITKNLNARDVSGAAVPTKAILTHDRRIVSREA